MWKRKLTKKEEWSIAREEEADCAAIDRDKLGCPKSSFLSSNELPCESRASSDILEDGSYNASISQITGVHNGEHENRVENTNMGPRSSVIFFLSIRPWKI